MATLARSPSSGVLLGLRTWRGEREPYPIQWRSTRPFIQQKVVRRFWILKWYLVLTDIRLVRFKKKCFDGQKTETSYVLLACPGPVPP